jgi:hypothetical protein
MEYQGEARNKYHIPDSEPWAHGFSEVKSENPYIETAAINPTAAGHIN